MFWTMELESIFLNRTWFCLIEEVLATQGIFLEQSGYGSGINCAFTFRAQVFGCFRGITAQFDLVKHKCPNKTTLFVNLCAFQITHGEKQCTTCQHANYCDTTNYSLKCFSYVIYIPQTTKILQNIWLTLRFTPAVCGQLKRQDYESGFSRQTRFLL